MQHNPAVQVVVPTRGRYHQLALTLWSIYRQTYPYWELLIIDDNDDGIRRDIRGDLPLRHVLVLIEQRCMAQGLGSFRIFPGDRSGPHHAHQLSLQLSAHDLILRMDDDCVLEETCLEKLVETLVAEEATAVGPVILQPDDFGGEARINPTGMGRVGPNGETDGTQQWFRHAVDSLMPVEHLYSSFLYKRSAALEIGGYCLDYSKVGHREETDLTYRLHLNGGKLLVNSAALMWHAKSPVGGIRTQLDPSLWANDDALWQKRCAQLRESNEILIRIDGGLGDHICATPMIRAFKKRWPDKKLILAPCYPWVFENNPLVDGIVPLNTDRKDHIYKMDLYEWGARTGHAGPLSKTWCDMYGMDWDGDDLDCYAYSKIDIPDGDYIVLSPYAGNSITGSVQKEGSKYWLQDRWEAVLRELDIHVIQVGRKDETPIPGAAFMPDLPFAEVAYLVKHARAVLSTDNFIPHLAHALNVPAVVLFTCNDHERFGHDGKQVQIVGDRSVCKQVQCHGNRGWESESGSAQWLTHEHCNDRLCAKSIDVEQVVSAVKGVLS